MKYYDTYEQYCDDINQHGEKLDQYQSLDDILNDEELADVFRISKSNSISTADQRLINGFEEINLFIDKHKRIPSLCVGVQELKLSSRLRSIAQDENKITMLKNYDRHNIFPELTAPDQAIDTAIAKTQDKSINTSIHSFASTPNSLDEILADDEFNIFDSSIAEEIAEDIFTLKHVPLAIDRASADFVARRKPCKDFAKYEPLFQQCQADLKSGKRTLVAFSENRLREGQIYFVVNGVLGYLSKVNGLTKDPNNSKLDGRIYCVFENGTESNLLFRSLGKLLYENGFLVSTTQEEADEKFNDLGLIQNHVMANDQHTGHIYVLRSKSTNPRISEIADLYKIGYCVGAIEERIKNAVHEPTYLMAPVEIVAGYNCYNLNPQKLEIILHKLFKPQCLNIDIFGAEGVRYNPREWFVLPIHVILEAIGLINTGEISKYYYDHNNQSFKLLKDRLKR